MVEGLVGIVCVPELGALQYTYSYFYTSRDEKEEGEGERSKENYPTSHLYPVLSGPKKTLEYMLH